MPASAVRLLQHYTITYLLNVCLKIITLVIKSIQCSSLLHLRSCVLTSLDNRFNCLLQKLGIQVRKTNESLDLKFDDDVFAMAAALDPKFGFHWLQDHPGFPEDKDAIRQSTIS